MFLLFSYDSTPHHRVFEDSRCSMKYEGSEKRFPLLHHQMYLSLSRCFLLMCFDREVTAVLLTTQSQKASFIQDNITISPCQIRFHITYAQFLCTHY